MAYHYDKGNLISEGCDDITNWNFTDIKKVSNKIYKYIYNLSIYLSIYLSSNWEITSVNSRKANAHFSKISQFQCSSW